MLSRAQNTFHHNPRLRGPVSSLMRFINGDHAHFFNFFLVSIRSMLAFGSFFPGFSTFLKKAIISLEKNHEGRRYHVTFM